MAKKTNKKVEEPKPKPVYKSALCGLANAVNAANDLHADGYTILHCQPVVAADEDGKSVQAIYLLAKLA